MGCFCGCPSLPDGPWDNWVRVGCCVCVAVCSMVRCSALIGASAMATTVLKLCVFLHQRGPDLASVLMTSGLWLSFFYYKIQYSTSTQVPLAVSDAWSHWAWVKRQLVLQPRTAAEPFLAQGLLSHPIHWLEKHSRCSICHLQNPQRPTSFKPGDTIMPKLAL